MLAALGLLAATGDAVAAAVTNDPLVAIAAAVLTALTGVQTAQVSGLRNDFHTYRLDQEKRMKAIEDENKAMKQTLDRLDSQVQGIVEVAEPPPRRPRTGSHSTTKGQRPRTR